MGLFNNEDKKVLVKYIEWGTVNDYEDAVLNRWESIGFIKTRFDFDTMTEYAILTDMGRTHLERELRTY